MADEPTKFHLSKPKRRRSTASSPGSDARVLVRRRNSPLTE
jgi:hypothetical protein